MMASFFQMNTASSSGTRPLPSNTIANPRGDLKEITTRSGVSYDGGTGTRGDKGYGATEKLHFELSFADVLLHMPKFATMFKCLLNNKEKLFYLAITPLDEYLALADLGASTNLMPLSIWKKLSLPELTPTQMILELVDRSTTQPAGIAEDVFVKVGKTGRVLIDVYGEELTLRHDDEAVTFKVCQTSRYIYNDAESINRIDVIDVACGEYAQEVLGFSEISTSGNPTSEPIISTSSPTLTPFGDSDFLLEETDAFLAIEDDSISPEIDDSYYDSEGDIRLLEEFLNDDPSSPLPPQELRFVEPKTKKSSIDDPPELELKDLPSHLEYAFLEGTDKLPIIIAKDLKEDEKV
ncbi:reverse transcriptase domain-containing protein [Tanacetum coccineum]